MGTSGYFPAGQVTGTWTQLLAIIWCWD